MIAPPLSARIVACGLCLFVAAFSGTAPAKKKPKGSIDPSSVPAWVHEAIARDDGPLGGGLVWLHDEKIVEPLPGGGVRVTQRLVGRAGDVSAVNALKRFSLFDLQGDEIEQLP